MTMDAHNAAIVAITAKLIACMERICQCEHRPNDVQPLTSMALTLTRITKRNLRTTLSRTGLGVFYNFVAYLLDHLTQPQLDSAHIPEHTAELFTKDIEKCQQHILLLLCVIQYTEGPTSALRDQIQSIYSGIIQEQVSWANKWEDLQLRFNVSQLRLAKEQSKSAMWKAQLTQSHPIPLAAPPVIYPVPHQWQFCLRTYQFERGQPPICWPLQPEIPCHITEENVKKALTSFHQCVIRPQSTIDTWDHILDISHQELGGWPYPDKEPRELRIGMAGLPKLQERVLAGFLCALNERDPQHQVFLWCYVSVEKKEEEQMIVILKRFPRPGDPYDVYSRAWQCAPRLLGPHPASQPGPSADGDHDNTPQLVYRKNYETPRLVYSAEFTYGCVSFQLAMPAVAGKRVADALAKLWVER